MRVASLNLHRRLLSGHDAIRAWCDAWSVDLLLLQECWPPSASYRAGPPLPGLTWVGGDSELGAYARPSHICSVVRHAPHHLEVAIHGRTFHSVYLDSQKARARERQLLELLETLPPQPTLVAGDFNLAPTPPDGLYGGEPSTWTKAYERRALAHVLDRGLEDLGLGSGEFTFERLNRGKLTQFRCDLAFVSPEESVASFVHAHDARLGRHAFTDHSGTVVDFAEPRTWRTWNTRISRPSLSAPTRLAMERVGNGIQSVLDYGCGRGQDVERLRAARPELEVAGFEPLQPPPAFSELPTGTFDLVLFNYVVNILPSLRERIEATRGAWAKVRPGGTLFISSRTPAAVGEQGERYLDGWISSARRSTFQRGHTAPELERLAAWLDQVEEVDSGVKGDFAWTTFRKTGGSWPTPPPAGTRLIDRRADLADVTEALAEADIVGVDVETFDRRHQVLSTVQLAVEGQVFVVDALAIRDLGWLRPVLEDPSTLKVIHNATFEQTAFRRYGLELQNVFCTLKVAKRAVPGPHTLEALAKRLLDVELNKTQQRSDWSLRPLTPAQIAYAATDASILLRLFRELRKATLA